jgi:hypothetical protein
MPPARSPVGRHRTPWPRACVRSTFAAEYRIILHRQPQGANIALHCSRRAVPRGRWPPRCPEPGPGSERPWRKGRRLERCIGPNGQPALGEVNGPLHAPIHNQVFTALHFAAESRRSCRCALEYFPLPYGLSVHKTPAKFLPKPEIGPARTIRNLRAHDSIASC